MPVLILISVLIVIFLGWPHRIGAGSFEIEIRAVSLSPELDERFVQGVLQSPEVRNHLEGGEYRVTEVRSKAALEKKTATGFSRREASETKGSRFSIRIYDPTQRRRLVIHGTQGDESSITVTEEEESPDATEEEYAKGLEILKNHEPLGSWVREGRLKPYRAMPFWVEESSRGRRLLSVGLRPTSRELQHEIVSIDIDSEEVLRYAESAPPSAIATRHACGPVEAGQAVTKRGTPGAAEIRVSSGGEALWEMRVIRPSASSGRWGSGIELVDVKYRGRMVLARAHAPILSVDYRDDVCGPFRDPVHHENSFQVEGAPIAPGFIQTQRVPETIFETRNDHGNFRGVAVFEDEGQLVLMSELSAGWYRYVSEFRFFPDGTIKPRFKFDAVHNSCTCQAHVHHVYWRFDFDLGVEGKDVFQVLEDGRWRMVRQEERHLVARKQMAWRVLNAFTGEGYEMTRGPYDLPTTDFGGGDAWVLRYKSDEIDDSKLGSSKNAKIDSFRNGESVVGEDLVFWYAGHVTHEPDGTEVPHIVGPTFRPLEP